MKHEIRLDAAHHALHGRQVADVANHMRFYALGKPQLVENTRLGGRGQGKPMNLRTERKQPLAEPRTLEAGVPSHQGFLASVAIKHIYSHTFHGALPSA